MSPRDLASYNSPEMTVKPPSSRVGLTDLAWIFLRIGLASFSLAALGETKTWVTRKRKWFTDDEYMQGLALAQLLPGAPTVNLSSYLGFRLRGLPGAIAATVSFLVPCFLLMLVLSHLYLRYGEVRAVSGLFRGLGALVVGLVLNTLLNLWKSGVRTPFHGLMALAGFALVFWLKLGIIRILLIAGAASLAVTLLGSRLPAVSRLNTSWGALLGLSPDPHHGPDGMPQGAAPRPTGEQASICSQQPLPLSWRKIAALLGWLGLIVAVDLALIRLRPDFLAMGASFLRIGALTFGSGYAMLPFIQDTVVTQFGWLTDQQFAVALALSLITPGPVTIIGAFIGYKVGGPLGALAGVVNMYFPAWALTAIVAAPYAKAGRVPGARQVIGGIVAAFIGTLMVVLIRLCVGTIVDMPALAMAAAAFLLQRFAKRVDTVWIVLGGAIISLVVFR